MSSSTWTLKEKPFKRKTYSDAQVLLLQIKAIFPFQLKTVLEFLFNLIPTVHCL